MIGSIFENPQDAQSGMWPILMLVMIPFFISMSMIENPDNPIANIASMAPFSAIIVMPAKMALVDVPIWKVIFSTIVNIATVFAIFPIAGKIFRVGIMMLNSGGTVSTCYLYPFVLSLSKDEGIKIYSVFNP